MIVISHRFDGMESSPIQRASKFPFGRGQAGGDAPVPLASHVNRLGKGFEQRLDDVVRFVAVEQLQVKIAAGLVGETLKKLPSEAEPERGRHVLPLLRFAELAVGKASQTAPDQMRPAAEINHAPRQAFIHRHEGLAGEWIARVKSRAVTAKPALVPQRLDERLT